MIMFLYWMFFGVGAAIIFACMMALLHEIEEDNRQQAALKEKQVCERIAKEYTATYRKLTLKEMKELTKVHYTKRPGELEMICNVRKPVCTNVKF